ncbi:interaptin [Copidosoma floridanum]|uniref:interaptin n=1 Tax=Copidosoma floridanum TaxID=29053 RepID=UPI0006C9B0CF|nr:interaptin [Copidosoma floridanum]
MNLVEVEELLERIENRDSGVDTRLNKGQSVQINFQKPIGRKNFSTEKTDYERKKMDQHKLKFNVNGHTSSLHGSIYHSDAEKKKDASDLTLHNDSSFSSLDTDKFMIDFKPSYEASESKISLIEPIIFEENEKFVTPQPTSLMPTMNQSDAQSNVPNNTDYSLENKKDTCYDATLVSRFTEEMTKSQTISPSVSIVNQNTQMMSCKSCPSIFKTPSSVCISNHLDSTKHTEFLINGNGSSKSCDRNNVSTSSHVEQQYQKPQRLLTLSDFWNQDSSKSQEEQLKIKLEEEKLKRQHCEKMIQELQKKLLEQQEKIAVAIGVDDEKNLFIAQFQMSWKKMKHKLCELESERENLQKLIKSISDKHQLEITECQEQIKKNEDELSKALNLATGYKEKSDSLVKEKLELLKSHADELESYKSLVQEAESRYEEMKKECQKLLEKNQQTDETLKSVQQDLNKELIKSNEVKSELAIIHKALDTCEAELALLRQEKENAQLKLKEELSRNSILEQGKASLLIAVDEVKKAEKLAKNEVKSLMEQQEKLRAELRDIYQKQVDEVVKNKLQEFQKQLDSAEMIFQNELETKQRAIAEIAARKIKSVIDKHQLEINLVEEKHKEEKKLYEVKLAQETQKSAMFEVQLNTYRKSKTNIVEQLHSMMQKQWQQALLIISGGNLDNLPSIQQINVEKLFDNSGQMNLDLVSKPCNGSPSKPVKLERQTNSNLQSIKKQEHQEESFLTLTSNDETPPKKDSKNDFEKYIKMILNMQRSQDDYSKPKFFNTSPTSSHNENSNKNFTKKDTNTSNDENSTWQPNSEMSVHDTSEYLSVPQKFSPCKTDQQKQKPPWK